MEQSLQKYYEETFSMMSTDGWNLLIEDFEKLKTSLNDLSTVADTQTLYFRQGQLDILNLVLQRKEACEKVYQELQDEQNL
jgi:vacuolar-type H+-ATPase subunit I/STV1